MLWQKSCQITYIEFDSYNKNFNLTSDLISKGPAITKLYFGDEMGYIRVFDLKELLLRGNIDYISEEYSESKKSLFRTEDVNYISLFNW